MQITQTILEGRASYNYKQVFTLKIKASSLSIKVRKKLQVEMK